VLIKANDHAKITLRVPVSELGLYDERMQYVVEPGEFEVQIGNSADNIFVNKTVVVK
jgi:beta-glucosidase